MASFNKLSSIVGIVGNLIIVALFAYDAVESMGQNRHIYSIVLKYSVAGFFAARMVIGIIEFAKKEEQAWKYVAYIALSVYLLISFAVIFTISCHFMEGCPWYYLVIGFVFCIFMASEELKYKREYIKAKSNKQQ